MEDDLKTLKVEYFSNHLQNLPQILNLCIGDQTKIKDIATLGLEEKLISEEKVIL
jgi:hypothetical protein